MLRIMPGAGLSIKIGMIEDLIRGFDKNLNETSLLYPRTLLIITKVE
jgi:hypothetical protein